MVKKNSCILVRKVKILNYKFIPGYFSPSVGDMWGEGGRGGQARGVKPIKYNGLIVLLRVISKMASLKISPSEDPSLTLRPFPSCFFSEHILGLKVTHYYSLIFSHLYKSTHLSLNPYAGGG